MTDHIRPHAGSVEYQHRACLGCGKRIPRWIDGKQTPSSQQFCSPGCGRFYRRLHPVKRGRRNAKKDPILRAFVEPVLAVEGRPEYHPCRACGRAIRTELVFCNDRCRDYVPLPPRKPDGEWFVCAGPVEYCSGCGSAIVPHQLPYRVAGELICRACKAAHAAARPKSKASRPRRSPAARLRADSSPSHHGGPTL